MKKIGLIFTAVLSGVVVAACDLQPKILSFPDTVGEFISARYPALLADPETQPEIYNSAASDYGVYAAPTLYGSVENTDYVEYASVDDYIVPPSVTALYGDVSTGVDVGESVVATADTQKYEYLTVPMYGGETVFQDTEITVAPGDTLYSVARRDGA